MLRLQMVDDLIELFEVDRWADWAVVDLQLVLEGLEQEFILEVVRISEDQV